MRMLFTKLKLRLSLSQVEVGCTSRVPISLGGLNMGYLRHNEEALLIRWLWRYFHEEAFGEKFYTVNMVLIQSGDHGVDF